jgi:hypothetical protein
LMSWGAPTWLETVWSYSVEAIDNGIIFWIKNQIKSKPKNLLEFQKNCKNWVWKEKPVYLSMCSHLGANDRYYTSINRRENPISVLRIRSRLGAVLINPHWDRWLTYNHLQLTPGSSHF